VDVGFVAATLSVDILLSSLEAAPLRPRQVSCAANHPAKYRVAPAVR
jgi:hypothetical protein